MFGRNNTSAPLKGVRRAAILGVVSLTTLASACGRSAAETAPERDPCIYVKREIQESQVIGGKYVASQFVEWFPPHLEFGVNWIEPDDLAFATFEWGGTHSRVHVEATRIPGQLVYALGYDPNEEQEPNLESPAAIAENECGRVLVIPAQIRLYSDDGLLDETFKGNLQIGPAGRLGAWGQEIRVDDFKGRIFDGSGLPPDAKIELSLSLDSEMGWFGMDTLQSGENSVTLQSFADEEGLPIRMLVPAQGKNPV